jgi:aspartokinase/homoserine dehydrogenase 1
VVADIMMEEAGEGERATANVTGNGPYDTLRARRSRAQVLVIQRMTTPRRCGVISGSIFPNVMGSRAVPIHVHKLGGASLADAAAVAHAVSVLRGLPGHRVLVVSALAGVTDALLRGAEAAAGGDEEALVGVARSLSARHRRIAKAVCGPRSKEVLEAIGRSFGELEALAHGVATLRELTARTSDYIVARGERLSARIVAAALRAAGTRAEYVDAVEVIRCDEKFGGASPRIAPTSRIARSVLAPKLASGIVPVVPGFIGRTDGGQVATLGRGGSDLTATLLARALRARGVHLWKDVPGLMTADPRVVPDARVIPQLTPREAAELAYYGAKVLHPRALIPLGRRPVPVYVRPFADPTAAGTEVSNRRTLRQYPVKALSAIDRQALVTVSGNGMLGVPGIAARTFAALHAEGVSVSLISQASSEHSICFSIPEASARAAESALRRAFAKEMDLDEIDGVEVVGGVTTIAVVGLGMSGTPGIAARVFDALARGGINVVAIAQGSSELNISCVVATRDATSALRRVHAAFQLDRIGGGGGAKADRVDVILLGFGQIGRGVARLIARSGRRTRRLRIVGLIDRSGYVFDANGLGGRRLRALATAKDRGVALTARERGKRDHAAGTLNGRHRLRRPDRETNAEHSVGELARHALSHPILVDVTATDTAPALRVALRSGMDVVLANKRPLGGPASDARELWNLARQHGRKLLHETTVGAGLPIIDTFEKLIESHDRVLRIDGCTSGTLGYVLTEVERGRTFSSAIRRALQLGLTEPDPRDDLSGMDVARKALILGRLLGFRGELDDVKVESLVPIRARTMGLEEFLRRLDEFDEEWRARVDEARRQGRVLRYVASATRKRVRVGLQSVSTASPFAGLSGTDNQVVFTSTRYRTNPLVITGPGAGPDVTAAGVLNDVLKAAGA